MQHALGPLVGVKFLWCTHHKRIGRVLVLVLGSLGGGG